MGVSAGGKDVRTRPRKAPARKTQTRKARRGPLQQPATPQPQPRLAPASDSPNFAAARKPNRSDGAVDWSTNETLVAIDFGFGWKKYRYLKERIKEMEAATEEIKEELLAALEAEDMESVAVEDRLVKASPGKSVRITEANLLKIGVDAGIIAKAKKLGTTEYVKLTSSNLGAEE